MRQTLVALAILSVTWSWGPRDASAQAPLLDAAFTCGRVGEVGGLRPGGDLYRIGVDQAAFPDALCNDGTRAVFFVRRACPSMPEVANYWHIHLEGGGA